MDEVVDLFLDPLEAAPPPQAAIDWLVRQGVARLDLVRPWPVYVARVQFLADRRYAPVTFGTLAYVLPVLDDGAILDVVAWAPKTGETATRFGVGAMLGKGQIGCEGRGTTGLAMPIWRTPLNWLRAGRRGLVVIDDTVAAHLLAGIAVAAEDRDHVRDLERRLRVPGPRIVAAVTQQERAAA